MLFTQIVHRITIKLQAQNMLCPCSAYGITMNNFLSYCGLVDARISASEKDLLVRHSKID